MMKKLLMLLMGMAFLGCSGDTRMGAAQNRGGKAEAAAQGQRKRQCRGPER